MLYHLPEPATGLSVGALGTFDFPAGCYAYLGSAFGGGGVRARTGRHLTCRFREKWNVDWLKPLCAPAVRWTHDRRKVEFAWAAVLGASFPAPGFGAADNPGATAHLVRFDAMPSFELFRDRASAAVADHGPVFEKAVENWAGAGWPN